MNCEIGWTCSEDRQLVRFFPNVRKTDLLDNYEATAVDDADVDDDDDVGVGDGKLTRTHQRSRSRQNLVGSQN